MHKRTSHVNSDTTPIAQVTVLGQTVLCLFLVSNTLYRYVYN